MPTLADLRGFDAGQFIQMGQAGQRQRTLADLGQYAARGDYRGAAGAAFAGGEPEMGAKLQGMADDERAKLVEETARFALGTADKASWEAARPQWQAKGFDLPPFEGREALIKQAVPVVEQIRARQAQANADRSFALDQRKVAQADAGGGNEYGLNGIPGVDAKGNPIILQTSKSGQGGVARFPEGARPLGPGGIADARTTATVDAKTAGKARELLPGAEQAVAIAGRAVDLLRQDTGGQQDQFGRFLGVIPQQWTPAIPGTPKAKFRVNLEQAGGQAFMQARQMLKGGGQITDYEGRRGEAAYSRMQAAAEQGDRDQFLTALDDFEEAVNAGYEKLKQTAQGGGQRGGPVTINGYTIEQDD